MSEPIKIWRGRTIEAMGDADLAEAVATEETALIKALPGSQSAGWAHQALTALKAEKNRRALDGAFVADPVNRPAHYTAGAVECIDAIESALTPEEFAGFCKGNAIKYVWRERRKGGAETLAKAAWYLDRLANVGERTAPARIDPLALQQALSALITDGEISVNAARTIEGLAA